MGRPRGCQYAQEDATLPAAREHSQPAIQSNRKHCSDESSKGRRSALKKQQKSGAMTYLLLIQRRELELFFYLVGHLLIVTLQSKHNLS